ncbi:hypothetical protein EN795_36870, partial [bacterium M00.F.Ca.ET.152.01.1.1]
MTSMRFSRANPPGVSTDGNDDFRRPQEARRHSAASPQGEVVPLRTAVGSESHTASSDSPGGEFGGATWQQYFFLAPNVRFTRTPDCDKRP